VKEQTDVLPDDYFFLCSDGILEHIVDNQLIALMDRNAPDSEKMNEILEICREKSKDNFSCCLVHIKSVENGAQKQNDSLPIQQKNNIKTPFQQNVTSEKAKMIVTAVQPQPQLSHKLLRLLMILALISGLICIAFVINQHFKNIP
jgi:hypothetical protein